MGAGAGYSVEIGSINREGDWTIIGSKVVRDDEKNDLIYVAVKAECNVTFDGAIRNYDSGANDGSVDMDTETVDTIYV